MQLIPNQIQDLGGKLACIFDLPGLGLEKGPCWGPKLPEWGGKKHRMPIGQNSDRSVIVFWYCYRYQLSCHLLSGTSTESSVDWWRLPLRGIWKELVGQSLPPCGWSWDSSGLGTKSMGWTIFHQRVSYKLNKQYHFYICILQYKVKILLFIIYDAINLLLPF